MSVALPGARVSPLRGARALFTSRAGGVSTGDAAGLNLARHVGDDDTAVDANRDRVERAMGVSVLYVDQVHSPDVLVVEDLAGDEEGRGLEVLRARPRTADALVTSRRDVALAMMVADCLPVLLVDAEAGVIGAAHAGRRGLLDGVLEATVEAMARRGARPGAISADIGPSVCGACYEVPLAMREEAETTLSGIGADTSWGTPSLDLRAGAVTALARAGVPRGAIGSQAPCTVEDPAYFSYRRAARTGRQAGVIRLL